MLVSSTRGALGTASASSAAASVRASVYLIPRAALPRGFHTPSHRPATDVPGALRRRRTPFRRSVSTGTGFCRDDDDAYPETVVDPGNAELGGTRRRRGNCEVGLPVTFFPNATWKVGRRCRDRRCAASVVAAAAAAAMSADGDGYANSSSFSCFAVDAADLDFVVFAFALLFFLLDIFFFFPVVPRMSVSFPVPMRPPSSHASADTSSTIASPPEARTPSSPSPTITGSVITTTGTSSTLIPPLSSTSTPLSSVPSVLIFYTSTHTARHPAPAV